MSTLPVPLSPATSSWAIPRLLEAPLTRRDPLATARRAFFLWLVLRTGLWTLAALGQPNPLLDTVEWISWGQHWQMGYHKHPPLAAWVADVAYRLTPGSYLGVYLAGYLAVALALWSVWRLACLLVPPRAALAATLCLDGLVYLGHAATEFNNQLLLIGFWTLAIERFHAAVSFDRLADWCLTGLSLGLALLCKYSAVFLILPLLGWWLWHEGLRRLSRPVIVAVVAGGVFLPHLLWLVANDYPTLHYAAQRARSNEDTQSPRLMAIVFLANQLVRLLPVLLILLPILRLRLRRLDPLRLRTRSLLVAAVLGPVVLHLAAGLFGGLQLRDLWGAPLWTFSALLLVAFLKTDDHGLPWRRLRLGWAFVSLLMLGFVFVSNLHGSALRVRPLRVHYPGALMAEELTARYQQRYGVPPAIAAGDWWLAGNLCCFAPHRPALYRSRESAHPGMDLQHVKGDRRRYLAPEPAISPWTSDEDVAQRGGVLVWDASTYGEDIPRWLHDRFPQAQCQRGLVLPFTGGSTTQLRVGWAMIAPGRK